MRANNGCRQLQSAIDGTTGIRMSDVAAVFSEVSRNPIAEEFMLDFLIENWEAINARFGNEFSEIQSIIKACLRMMRSEGQIMLVSVIFEF
ncbi:hypothetical protein ANCCAN_04646 [Ancylostoma caninum]|uniref:ERAP1-like C-terminal domain-containing protein n=1 Tax=Ancylostoma caninum TaxID=29170 RepID=A0A368GXZ6_ANCCA|nr:hypothetical protein ANCCAN_04646 [Ancylostoma caninum]